MPQTTHRSLVQQLVNDRTKPFHGLSEGRAEAILTWLQERGFFND